MPLLSPRADELQKMLLEPNPFPRSTKHPARAPSSCPTHPQPGAPSGLPHGTGHPPLPSAPQLPPTLLLPLGDVGQPSGSQGRGWMASQPTRGVVPAVKAVNAGIWVEKPGGGDQPPTPFQCQGALLWRINAGGPPGLGQAPPAANKGAAGARAGRKRPETATSL